MLCTAIHDVVGAGYAGAAVASRERYCNVFVRPACGSVIGRCRCRFVDANTVHCNGSRIPCTVHCISLHPLVRALGRDGAILRAASNTGQGIRTGEMNRHITGVPTTRVCVGRRSACDGWGGFIQLYNRRMGGFSVACLVNTPIRNRMIALSRDGNGGALLLFTAIHGVVGAGYAGAAVTAVSVTITSLFTQPAGALSVVVGGTACLLNRDLSRGNLSAIHRGRCNHSSSFADRGHGSRVADDGNRFIAA